MSEADAKPGAPPPSMSLTAVRHLWDSGARSSALHAVLDGWDALPSQGGDLPWLEGVLRSSGLIAEAFALRLRTTRQPGAQARDWAALVRSVLRSGDPWWAAELLGEAGGGSRELDELNIEVELMVGDAAAAIADWQRTYRDEAALESAVQWLVRCARIADAERLVEREPSLTLWRARLAIWRNQPAVARPLLAALPPSPAVRCLQAIAELQQGRAAEAEAMLRSLLDTEAQADAWTWLATALRKQGRHAEAGHAAQTATSMSPVFNVVLWMERMLAAEHELVAMHQASASRLRALLARVGLLRSVRGRRVEELEHAWALYPLGIRPDEPADRLAELIERFGGNHSAALTITDGQTLTSYPLPPDAGQLGVCVQLVLRTRGAAAVRALYRGLAPRATGPRFRLYEGETELWMGAYADAANIFRAILEEHRDVKWAWIGLGASAMLRGELREAQQIWQQGLSVTGSAGPTLAVYRGECYRRQGEREAARRELDLAVRQKPERLSAWINLALLDGEAELLARVERECVELMPILMAEIDGGVVHRLERVLEAMRGNRSSSRVTYHLWGRVWHAVTRVFDAPERLPRARLAV